MTKKTDTVSVVIDDSFTALSAAYQATRLDRVVQSVSMTSTGFTALCTPKSVHIAKACLDVIVYDTKAEKRRTSRSK